MRIAVIGAGIAGMCTAYELALDGHTVSIFERNAALAEEASFGCAGHISTSLAHPQAFPAWPVDSRLRNLLAPASIALGKGTSLRELRWLLAWKSDARDFAGRFASAHALVSYSLQRLHALTTQAQLAHEQSQGQMLLFKSETQQLAYQTRQNALSDLGVVSRALTPEQARVLEPALGDDLLFHSALVFPNDEIGNCRQFAHLVKDQLLECGAQFHFGTAISGVAQGAIQVQGMAPLAFDHVVVCAGASAASLLGKTLRDVALTEVWSTSISAHIREPLNAPHGAVLDSQTQVAIGRMGDRVRVSGGATLGKVNPGNADRTSQKLFQVLQSHFPAAADYSRTVQVWRGTSIFSPDALPLIGPIGAGVWVNLAHGHNGWSMACGAARVIADQIGGRQPDIDATKLLPSRFET
jgi:D-amino-acid dehydrogenase